MQLFFLFEAVLSTEQLQGPAIFLLYSYKSLIIIIIIALYLSNYMMCSFYTSLYKKS